MEKNKTHLNKNILVLMDFSVSSYIGLKYAISLAKLCNRSIEIYHGTSSVEIVNSYNQNVALFEIQEESMKIERKLKSIIEIISLEGIEASSHYSLGNVINELDEYLETSVPDVVVIGKKDEKLKSRVTNYLLNKYSGNVLIIGDENEINEKSNMILGFKDDTLEKHDLNFAASLNNMVSKPLSLVNVHVLNTPSKKLNAPNIWAYFNEKNVISNLNIKTINRCLMGLHKVLNLKKQISLELEDVQNMGFSISCIHPTSYPSPILYKKLISRF